MPDRKNKSVMEIQSRNEAIFKLCWICNCFNKKGIISINFLVKIGSTYKSHECLVVAVAVGVVRVVGVVVIVVGSSNSKNNYFLNTHYEPCTVLCPLLYMKNPI